MPDSSKHPARPLAVDEVLKFRCCGCGSCCWGWAIEVDDASRKVIEANLLKDPHPRLGSKLAVNESKGKKFLVQEEGHCVYLTEDNKCWLHGKFGPDVKPFICRTYPRRYVPTPAGFFTTLTFSCHTAAAFLDDAGTSGPERLDLEVETPQGLAPFRLTEGQPLSNNQYRRVEDEVLRILALEAHPVARRFCAAVTLVDELVSVPSGADPDAFQRVLEKHRSADIPPVAPQPLTEHVSILSALLRQRRQLIVPEIRGLEGIKRIIDALDKAYAINDVEAKPPAALRMNRALTRYWIPARPVTDRILGRYFNRHIWGKHFTYPHGFVNGLKILALLYAVIRAYATALAAEKNEVMEQRHLIAAIVDVDREFVHSAIAIDFWKKIFEHPLTSKPWFVPMLVL